MKGDSARCVTEKAYQKEHKEKTWNYKHEYGQVVSNGCYAHDTCLALDSWPLTASRGLGPPEPRGPAEGWWVETVRRESQKEISAVIKKSFFLLQT